MHWLRRSFITGFFVAAFSPDNEAGFKKVVLVDDERRGMMLGFLTREFTLDRGRGVEALVAVYVPTNHLYLGDVLVYPPDRVSYPDLSVEEAIRIFLTGGMALPEELRDVGAAFRPALAGSKRPGPASKRTDDEEADADETVRAHELARDDLDPGHHRLSGAGRAGDGRRAAGD